MQYETRIRSPSVRREPRKRGGRKTDYRGLSGGGESSVIGESHGADDSHGTSGACTYQHNHDRSYAVYVSPIHQQGFMYAGTPYLAGLQKCLELLRRCDILLLCGDWQNSKGCLAEFGFAMARKMPIVFENSNDYYDLI